MKYVKNTYYQKLWVPFKSRRAYKQRSRTTRINQKQKQFKSQSSFGIFFGKNWKLSSTWKSIKNNTEIEPESYSIQSVKNYQKYVFWVLWKLHLSVKYITWKSWKSRIERMERNLNTFVRFTNWNRFQMKTSISWSSIYRRKSLKPSEKTQEHSGTQTKERTFLKLF